MWIYTISYQISIVYYTMYVFEPHYFREVTIFGKVLSVLGYACSTHYLYPGTWYLVRNSNGNILVESKQVIYILAMSGLLNVFSRLAENPVLSNFNP